MEKENKENKLDKKKTELCTTDIYRKRGHVPQTPTYTTKADISRHVLQKNNINQYKADEVAHPKICQ